MKAVYQLLFCLFVCSAQAGAQVPVAAGISPAINVSAGYSYVSLSWSQGRLRLCACFKRARLRESC